jgi:DNA polymerase I
MPYKKRLLIIDSHALLHRAYHALPDLKNSQGDHLGAVYGFLTILLKSLADFHPDYLVACFDLPKPTIRHKKFPDYKAGRPKVDNALKEQFSTIKNILKAFTVPVLEKQGYEADDVIGTVVEKVSQKHPDIENIVLTGDLDTLQLINRQTKIFTPKRGISQPILYDAKKLRERYENLSPEQIIEFKALKGDPSDNIPGVPSIGEKTTLKILKRFQNIQNLYTVLESPEKEKKLLEEKFLSATIIKKLKENKDQAFFSRELATIYRDIPIEFSLQKARWNPDLEKITTALLEKGLRTPARRFQEWLTKGRLPEKKKPPQSIKKEVKQPQLF